jgi:CHAD domain-containing protein
MSPDAPLFAGTASPERVTPMAEADAKNVHAPPARCLRPIEVAPPPAAGTRRPAAAVTEEIERRRNALGEAAARVRARSDDEAIHDLRVASRRLATALDLWRELLRRRPRRRALRRLRALRRALGPARVAEVQLADLAERLPGEPAAVRIAAHELLERLRRRVARRRRRAARAAGARVVERTGELALRTTRGIARRAAALEDPLGHARRRFAAIAGRARAALLEAADVREDGALHRARIEVKKWRYALESLEATGAAPATAARPKDLKTLQDALGSLHDRVELRDRVAREIERRRRDGHAPAVAALGVLVGALERERREKLEEFLAAMPRFTSAAAEPS